MNIIREHFDSIHQMLSVIESRKNNSHMKGQNSSSSTDSWKWYGSRNFDEAKNLFQYGYTDVLDKIKAGLAKTNVTQIQNRRRVNTGVVGYAPHVPNAILGLPNSMIRTDAQPQKIKAISIVYCVTENCYAEAQEFIDSGVAVLNVINRLELQGVRVNLKIMFYCAKAGQERAFGTVNVKDYREHMDIKKLCFPIAHPSMFRRFGFRWLETVPQMQTDNWQLGYGSQATSMGEEECGENEFFMSLSTTKKFNYDADEIIKNLKL